MSNKEEARASVTVKNETGLHARPASMFVQRAARYTKCDILIVKGDTQINAKSIMGVMSGGIGQDCQIEIVATGEEAQEAVDDLVQLIESKFGEE